MNEWKEYKLGEILTLNYGKALKEQDRIKGEYPVYSSAGLTGYHNKPLVSSKGLIIGRKGTIGKVYYSHKPFYCIDTAYYILPKEDVYDMSYLYYALQTLHLEELNEDSAVPGLNRDTAYSQFILLPPLPEQRAIAAVLSSLDDKIDLLHRQNKTLEAMAETLFRQWFVEEAGEEVELEKVVDVKIGRTPPRKESQWFSTNEKDVKWISIKDLNNSGVYIHNTSEYITLEAVNKFKIPIIPINTVVLSFKLTIGRVAITTENMLSNEAIAHFNVPKNSILCAEYIYLFFKLFNFASLGSTSSIAEAINSSIIKNIKIPMPSKTQMEFFKNRVTYLFDKIKNNQSQIRTLTQTRDVLLPKLMSGEIRIKI